VVSAVVAVLLVAAVALGVMWHRSLAEARRAEAEAAQREAEKLVALGRLELADSPSRALVFAISSLERADTEAARRFAVEALAMGPPARFISEPSVNPLTLAWSEDGGEVALGGSGGLVLVDRGSGKRRQLSSTVELAGGFTSDGGRLVTQGGWGAAPFHVRALPEGLLERTITLPEFEEVWVAGGRVQTLSGQAEGSWLFRDLPLDGSPPEVLGRFRPPPDCTAWTVNATGTRLVTLEGGRIVERRLDDLAAPGRLIGAHRGAVDVFAWTCRDRAVTFDRTDGGTAELRLWDLPGARLERAFSSPGFGGRVVVDPSGRHFAAGAAALRQGSLALFDLGAPRSAEPTLLEGSDVPYLNTVRFSPDGRWLARVTAGTVTLWSVGGPRSSVIARQQRGQSSVVFTRDGDLLTLTDGILTRWPLSPADGSGERRLWSQPGATLNWELDGERRFVVLAEYFGKRVHVVPLEGAEASTIELERLPDSGLISHGRLSPDGRVMALHVFSSSGGHGGGNALQLLDLETGAERTLDTHFDGAERCAEAGSQAEGMVTPVWFPDGRLVSEGDGGLRLWDLATGTSRPLRGCRELSTMIPQLVATPDSRMILGLDVAVRTDESSSLWVFDLDSGQTREITSHGNRLCGVALDSSGTVLVTGDLDGVVRVGALDGAAPHLLFGHNSAVWGLEVSPDGRRIVSADTDGTIRLWPMPDLARPPLHTLPYDEMLQKLKSLTNLRAVRDPASDTGWKVEIGPFPGWADVPEWQP